MDISKQIVITRKAKGFTQQILADKANLSLSTIKRIENGKVIPRIHTLNLLSEILDIELLPNDLKNEKNKNETQIVFLSTLLVFLPPINIFFLLKSKSKNNEIVNRLLVSQISSLIIFLISLFVVPAITYIVTGHKTYGKINTPQILYICFVLFNIFAGLSILTDTKSKKDT